MDDIPFCINCKWVEAGMAPPKRCLHSRTMTADLVNGGEHYVFAYQARFAGQKCGPKGDLFEPKVTK